MYIGFYPYTICFKVVDISCFCICKCFGKIGFPFQKFKFWKIRILVFGKICKSQKWFKMFVTWFDFYSNMFGFQRYNKNLFL